MAERHCKKKHNSLSHPPPTALYVHVPFCRAKCRYCDFYSRPAGRELFDAYVHALSRELHARLDALALPLTSVYVGGGTPTVLGPEALTRLLALVAPLIDQDTEFSVEANPDSMSPEVAHRLAEGKVNRVTIGVQSFDAQLLELLGRIHTADQAVQAVAAARQAGITNIGIDLIYGIPGQTRGSWAQTLDRALDLPIEHVSCYGLSFEPGTELYQDLQRGHVARVDDGLQREMYDLTLGATERAGMEHYEISNFAHPGRRSLHNLTYWRNEGYLGLGPAAASYIDGERRTSQADLTAYLSAPADCDLRSATRETLTGRDEMAETVMLALRLTQGLDLASFRARFGWDALEIFPESISRYARQGALIVTDTHIRLARDAYFVSDTVLADILAEA